ncbi:MAG: NUDIX hydrolase [Candidatus Doudnabacteria bacterium]|nr:NUDIX hydrolase [Candidatus Doudnabacteria bacterium]
MENNKHTLSVTAVVEYEGKILFIKRGESLGNFASKWVFPGGKVEHGEDVIQALYRELREEIGLELGTDIAFLTAYQFTRKEDSSSSQGLVFLIKALNNTVIPEDGAISDHKWILPTEILKYSEETIYGMECHIRQAILVLRKKWITDWRLLSVTEYQNNNCSMDEAYLKDLQESDELLTKAKEFLPHRHA